MDSTGTAREGREALTDDEIVDRVRAGERELYEILLRRHNTTVYRACRSILGSDEEAEDVLQEAWVRAYGHRDQVEGRARFSTWVARIAAHEALRRIRSRRRAGTIDGDPEAGGDIMDTFRSDEPTPLERALDRELAGLLEAAIDALPPTYRGAFVLREIEGMSTAETAECLDLTEGAVKVRIHRARALLRRELEARTGAVRSEAFGFHRPRCDRVTAAVMARIAALR